MGMSDTHRAALADEMAELLDAAIVLVREVDPEVVSAFDGPEWLRRARGAVAEHRAEPTGQSIPLHRGAYDPPESIAVPLARRLERP